MNAKEKDIIIFTGQSGIKLESCINKLSEKDGIDYTLISIDKYMAKISGEKFVNVLGKPPRIQESLWIQAFEKGRKDIPPLAKHGKYIFLTLHACYYHQRKTEFICPVNLRDLIQLQDRTKMVIVLLDDCYDIYRRLMVDHQMYDDIMKSDPLNALTESIMNLVTILNWREIEIAFSRKIAQLLGVPMYTISVKHPSFIVSRLVSQPEESLNILYLSHPISSIRRSGVYARLPDFYTELSSFIQEVVKVDNMVLFIPDTIDELRILQNDKYQYIPELKNGWPVPLQTHWMCEKLPSAIEKINPLNPRNYPYSSAKDEIKSAISSQIRTLSEKIREQINSRDRTLVEQSKDGILVFRPYWAASVPSGVVEEVIYNSDLKDLYGEKARKAFMLTTCEDIGKLLIQKLFTLVEASVNITEDNIRKLKSLCEKWLDDSNMISSFYENSCDFKKIRSEIERMLPENYEFKKVSISARDTALAIGKYLHKAEKIDKYWQEIFDQVVEPDPLNGYTIEGEKLICKLDEFGEQSKIFVQKVVCRQN